MKTRARIEQQRRILVAARVQAGQRHQQLAPAKIRIAEQVEGGVGRKEAVAGKRAAAGALPQVRMILSISAGAGALRRRDATGFGLGWLQSIVSSSSATGGPISAQSGSCIARLRQRIAQGGEPGFVLSSGSPARRNSGHSAGIAQRGFVEFAEMRIAAGIVEQDRIADVIKGRAVFPGGQRAARRARQNTEKPIAAPSRRNLALPRSRTPERDPEESVLREDHAQTNR